MMNLFLSGEAAELHEALVAAVKLADECIEEQHPSAPRPGGPGMKLLDKTRAVVARLDADETDLRQMARELVEYNAPTLHRIEGEALTQFHRLARLAGLDPYHLPSKETSSHEQ